MTHVNALQSKFTSIRSCGQIIGQNINGKSVFGTGTLFTTVKGNDYLITSASNLIKYNYIAQVEKLYKNLIFIRSRHRD